MSIERWKRYAIAILMTGTLIAGSCLSSDTFPCGDARCPDGFQCIQQIDVSKCVPVGCGNGLLEGDEVCDDGNIDDFDGCRGDCRSNETCGNGLIDALEVCDDGNSQSGDGCSADCQSNEFCSNGYIDLARGEMCDDGNTEPMDGCSANCQSDETCGNGYWDENFGEICDDAGDSVVCDVDCTAAQCGDGYTNVVRGEECDDTGDSESCDIDCTAVQCGDGYTNAVAGEACDDLNTFAIDACSTTCQVRAHLVAGQNHTCALLANGHVRCWGMGIYGRLGYGDEYTVGSDNTPASAGDVDIGAPAVQIATGFTHTCALLNTGRVRCWGQGGLGQLGYGSTANVGDDETPADVGDVDIGTDVVQLAAGRHHTCALLVTGNVRCWGDGRYGKLGYGNIVIIGSEKAPVSVGDVDVGGQVTQITAGRDHTCALLKTGAVRCWGRNHQGQLGYGNTDSIGDDEGETPASVGLVDVGGQVVQISANQHHTCALLATGTIRCWGVNNGRLGYGHIDPIGDDERPSSAGDIDVGGPVIQVVAGGFHTCALLEGGLVRCWGAAGDGQLGYGNTDTIGDDETPASVDHVDVGGPVAHLTAGAYHTCATLESGDVRCWGKGQFGSLGHGNTDSIGDDETPASAGQVFVEDPFIDLAAGVEHACGLGESGAVRCWGRGDNGQLGYGNVDTIGDDETPSHATVDVGGPVIQLALGGEHTCALLANGAVRCWGLGSSGRLGYGDSVTIGDNETPASAGDVDVGGPASQIVCGAAHTCALLAVGSVRCWGLGSFGRLGYGNTVTIGDDESPASAGDVNVGGAVIQLAAGRAHTCALLDNGALRCWGTLVDLGGILGYGNYDVIGDDETPASVGDIDVGGPVSLVVAGGEHTCAQLSTGGLRCWGRGAYGPLGYGNTDEIGGTNVPASVGEIDVGGDVVGLTAGNAHTCALFATGGVRCWGQATYGQLGYGNTDNIGDDETPASVGDIDVSAPIAQIVAGDRFTCIRTDAGAIRCWGFAEYGQLGYGNTDTIGNDETPASFDDALRP